MACCGTACPSAAGTRRSCLERSGLRPSVLPVSSLSAPWSPARVPARRFGYSSASTRPTPLPRSRCGRWTGTEEGEKNKLFSCFFVFFKVTSSATVSGGRGKREGSAARQAGPEPLGNRLAGLRPGPTPSLRCLCPAGAHLLLAHLAAPAHSVVARAHKGVPAVLAVAAAGLRCRRSGVFPRPHGRPHPFLSYLSNRSSAATNPILIAVRHQPTHRTHIDIAIERALQTRAARALIL